MRALIALTSLLALSACDGGGIPTGTGPLRTPTLTVTARVPASDPRCDGSFGGSGSIVAAYPAGAGQPAVTQSRIGKENVNNVSFNIDPEQARFNGPASSPQDFMLTDAKLTDPCQAGSFNIKAESTDNRTPPLAVPTVDHSPVVNVPAVGFKITEGLSTSMQSNARFKGTFKLSCCPMPAGAAAVTYQVEWSNEVNVASVTPNPANRRITCPGADVAFTLDSHKQQPGPEAHYTVRVRDIAAGGRVCHLGPVQAEGS
jgi:hypothetical protein